MKVSRLGVFLSMAIMADNSMFETRKLGDIPRRSNFTPVPEYIRKTCKSCRHFGYDCCPKFYKTKPKSKACKEFKPKFK